MLTDLHLHQFRCYTDAHFELGHQTVITGPNGVGKTNILEAVSLLSLTTSWRTSSDVEVIQWDQPFTRIVSGVRELVIQRHPYYKRIRIDGVSKRVGEVIGTMPSVLFQPDDSNVVYGSPAYRRQVLDRLLSQTHPGYMRALNQLHRIVKQRNKLLKRIKDHEASEDELTYWDEQLANEAAIIDTIRVEALPIIKESLTRHFEELVPQSLALNLEYLQSPRRTQDYQSFLHHLAHNRHKEISAGTTLYGPHREDLLCMWGEHPAVEGMSRGQVRALVLALKLAEIDYIEKHSETAPILLLDDVFSEFDLERRRKITSLSKVYQTILTTTDVSDIKINKEAAVIPLS